jgi:hypothetical protein
MLKLGRLFVVAFAVCAVSALGVRAQDEKKKEDSKPEAKQDTKSDAAKARQDYQKRKMNRRLERGPGGEIFESTSGKVEKVEGDKITLKDDDGKEHTFTVGDHTKFVMGKKKITSLGEANLHEGSVIYFTHDKNGKLIELDIAPEVKRLRGEHKEKEEASEKPKAKDKSK